MSVTEINNKIDEVRLNIKQKKQEIIDLESNLNLLYKSLKSVEEESLMDYLQVGDEFELSGWVRLGRKISLRKNDIFVITKMNKKSLYIKLKLKNDYDRQSRQYIPLPQNNKIYSKEIKITSAVFYNNFKKEIKDILSQYNRRNDLLDALLD